LKTIAFIINPISGTKSKRCLPELIQRTFSADKGFEAIVYFTKCAGDAAATAKKFAAEGYYAVVAVGGDGTVNEVARGLAGSSTALGIVPTGSGNGFARHLHIPLNPRRALAFAAKASPRKVDHGWLNGHPFFCTAGVGFDARIGHKFAQAGKRGFASYLRIILREFFSYKPCEYSLCVDGISIRRTAFLITFANASQWGNNGYIAPAASVYDGLLDLVVVGKFRWFHIPRIAFCMFTKRAHWLRFVETFRCRSATVECNGVAHYDGEPLTTEACVKVDVAPAALSVLH
jgi:YegS/Rv2252/BmrU family lipid kinase